MRQTPRRRWAPLLLRLHRGNPQHAHTAAAAQEINVNAKRGERVITTPAPKQTTTELPIMSTNRIIAAPAVASAGKHIAYDPETRDYAMYLDGQLVGFARTYHEAEITLDQLVYDQLTHSRPTTAAGGE
jgi:hypothetical protein